MPSDNKKSSSFVDAQLNLAIACFNKGRLSEAGRHVQDILGVNPVQEKAVYLSALISSQLGDTDTAIGHFIHAISLNPHEPLYQYNYVLALCRSGRLRDALVVCEQEIDIRPNSAELLHLKGNILWTLGSAEDALHTFQSLLEIIPDSAEAHSSCGEVLCRLGRVSEALAACDRALKLAPGNSGAHLNRGNILEQLGRKDEAIAAYEQAIENNPDNARAFTNMGVVLWQLGRREEAFSACERAVQLQPDLPRAQYNLGNIASEIGNRGIALDCFRKALSVDPGFINARWAYVMAQIPAVYDSPDAPGSCRAGFSRELGVLDSMITNENSDRASQCVGYQQPFYLAYQEHDNRDLFARYGALCSRIMNEWQVSQGICRLPACKDGPARVGIVSSHIHTHSVWDALLKGWYRHLDRKRIQIYTFYIGSKQDAETDYAEAASAVFIRGRTSLRQWAEKIIENNIEVLIYPEIGMDQLTVKLASMRLSPVQVASWGHPVTTGLPTIDLYLSAGDFEPDKAERHYTEQLVKLPNLGCCYEPESHVQQRFDVSGVGIDPALPVLLCPGVPFKYTPENDWVLTEIARRLGKCQFVFLKYRIHQLSDIVQRRLMGSFLEAGLNISDYVKVIPWQDRTGFHGLMKSADLFLDTIGFSGFNTTMQAIECALPIVTLDGKFMRGKLASSIMQKIGLDDIVAGNREEYISITVRLIQDSEYRMYVRDHIVTARNRLYSDLETVRALESFLINEVSSLRSADASEP